MTQNTKEITLLNEVGDAVLMSNDPHFESTHIQVAVEGRKYQTTLTKKFIERKQWSAPNPNEIKSHIPGEVAQLLVKEGDKVLKGDKIMIYEAMKMKNIIASPFDAYIEKIYVKEGDKLPKGALLLTVSPILKK